ncbi:hypothetical protein HYW41_04515 [Candidatus Daviesbacteria bacterium]|nr:hypothetical protein [Candidatus Daviesbacteria bacterium]
MKLLLLHGSAKTASRKKLIDLKQGFDTNNVVVFEEGFDLQTILGALVTPLLFSDLRLIILENPPEDFTNYQLPTTNYQLIMWFDHEVNQKKAVIKWVESSKGQILFFPEAREVSVFPFLDYLATSDKKAFIEIEKLKNAGFEMQYFITMVFYLLRNLAVTPKGAKPFMREKLERQRKNFNLEKIINLYKNILDIDFKIKSGLLEKPQAEFLLVNLFCHQV